MDITLTIPDASKDICIDALCTLGKYQTMIDEVDEDTGDITQVPNPVSRTQFAKAELIQLLKRRVKRYIQIAEEETFAVSLQVKKDAIDAITIS
jgi:hypothetical protein